MTPSADELAPLVLTACRKAARKHPGLSPDDLTGACWVAALEATKHLDGRPWRNYMRVVLSRHAYHEALRVSSPVSLPKSREQHTFTGYARELKEQQDMPNPDDEIYRRQVIALYRAALPHPMRGDIYDKRAAAKSAGCSLNTVRNRHIDAMTRVRRAIDPSRANRSGGGSRAA